MSQNMKLVVVKYTGLIKIFEIKRVVKGVNKNEPNFKFLKNCNIQIFVEFGMDVYMRYYTGQISNTIFCINLNSKTFTRVNFLEEIESNRPSDDEGEIFLSSSKLFITKRDIGRIAVYDEAEKILILLWREEYSSFMEVQANFNDVLYY